MKRYSNGLKGQQALSPGRCPGLGAFWPFRPSLRNLRKFYKVYKYKLNN